jgi:hypothetical protein
MSGQRRKPMADNYTFLSFEIEDVNAEQYAWLRKVTKAIENNDDACPIGELGGTQHEWAGWNFSTHVTDIQGDEEIENVVANVCIYTEESCDLEALGDVLVFFLRKFRPDDIIGFEYAHTCSKPRPGEFGGGALVASADYFLIEGTYATRCRLAQDIKAELPATEGV